jgi:hypothetical protein
MKESKEESNVTVQRLTFSSNNLEHNIHCQMIMKLFNGFALNDLLSDIFNLTWSMEQA